MTDLAQYDSLQSGWDALGAADWPAARRFFEEALAERDSPEAHDGLGLALWWLNAIPEAHHHRQAAYRGYKTRGDARRAAMLAAWLAREQVFLSANFSAMRGWFARAERLLAGEEACVEQGWLMIWRASLLSPPQELAQTAEEVFRMAQNFGDDDLQTLALALGGVARVNLGQVDRGMVHLDEAMVAVSAGEVGWMTVSEVFCLLLTACDLAGDLERTEQWCRTAADYASRRRFPFLAATCRVVYGSLLAAAGHWNDAEKELTGAIDAFNAGHRALRAGAMIKLADLRVSQGRLEEADALLSGYIDHGSAVLPLARLYRGRGELALARATLEQALNGAAPATIDQAPLLRLLVEVLLEQGELDGADRAAHLLAALAGSAGSDLLLAQADLAEGQVRRAAGEPQAGRCFQSAIDRLQNFEQSLLSSQARLEMARLLGAGDPPGAITWARAALVSFERLGADHYAGQAAQLLQQLGAPRRGGPRREGQLTQREEQVLALIATGLSNREIAARLVVSPKTVEHHVGQILAKLGARSRAEAAAYAASHPIQDRGGQAG